MEFFDTNILVYAVDPTDRRRRDAAREAVSRALRDGTFVLSTQVMQEFYYTVIRKSLLGHDEAVQLLRQWARGPVVTSTPGLLWAAFELRLRHQLSLWDALIVQAALDAGCARLFTEDLQHGMRIGDLEIVDPF